MNVVRDGVEFAVADAMHELLDYAGPVQHLLLG